MTELYHIKLNHENQMKKLRSGKPIMYMMHPSDVEYLINRVEVLEEEKHQDPRQAVLEGMYEENERYKQALEDIRDISTGAVHEFAKHALEGDNP